ncbi:MAG TPA: hypothetical protein VHC67_18085 [Gaiellaceae bacterium]|nr:hypothetical protein [Gaiellaceae bacterium]
MRRLIPTSKAPLALAAFLALPVFFASLMAVSLAIEKPKAYEWMRDGRLMRTFHDPTASTEARIWLLSFVPPLLLVAVGLAASHLRRTGIYVVCATAIVGSLLLLARLNTWKVHHTSRYPFGEDLYPDSSPSSLTNRGQWESEAAHTVHTLVGYTIGLAIVAALITATLEWRRRHHARLLLLSGGGSELQQTGGAPTATEL